MAKKIVLILQGGGALGAFQCGAWKALFPFIRDKGHELVAVAGASIGAVNAAMIARRCHEDDGGCEQLQDFWINKVATAPVPFFPLPGEYWRAWNGLLTGLLLGNRSLFRPAYQHWNPLGDRFRFYMPLYETYQAERTLVEAFGEYRGSTPLLAVGATEVTNGETVLFDSARQTITPKMITASTAIPILFSPVEINDRYYWDGELRSNTLLPNVLALLRAVLPRTEEPEDYLVIVVDMFQSRAEREPASTIESHYRFLNILLGNKLKHERQMLALGNEYLGGMDKLRRLAMDEQASPLTKAVEEEYRKALANQYARFDFLHIERSQFEYEYISRDFDYSPQYIERLMKQGYANASKAIAKYSGKMHPGMQEARQDLGPSQRPSRPPLYRV